VRLSRATYTGIDFWIGRTLRDLALWIETVNKEDQHGRQNV